MTLDEAKKKFHDEVFVRAETEVDPSQRHDWESLALGYLLALGFSEQDPEVCKAAVEMSWSGGCEK